MPTFRAIYTDYPWTDLEVEQALLAKADCALIPVPDRDEATLIKYASQGDVLINCWAQVTSRVIDAATRCRHIARTGIGLDSIDVSHATSRGIVVTHVPDYCIPEVAEHTMALLFALGRKLHVYHQASQRGEYHRPLGLPIERMEEQTVGIIGLGRIGSLVARHCRALGMHVVGHNRSRQVPAGVQWQPLEQLLRTSDYVVLLCPLTEETTHLIGQQELAQMKPTAFLINTSRGGLVDSAALAAALAAGQLQGAGLDVQEIEPPNMDQAPYNDPRVLVTPHVAYHSTRATLELRTRVAQQVVALLRGKRPEHVVNPQVLNN